MDSLYPALRVEKSVEEIEPLQEQGQGRIAGGQRRQAANEPLYRSHRDQTKDNQQNRPYALDAG